MKLLGVLGGMSWISTAEYYRLLNEEIAARLGSLHSARLLLHSLDFAEMTAMQKAGQWQEAGELLAEAVRGLEKAGAGALLLATNTMHKVAPAIGGP
jgi:aspartate racemase